VILISKKEAKARGLKKFYTGVPCKWGHDAQRYVKSGNCCACVSVNTRRNTKRFLNMDMGAMADDMVEVKHVWVHQADYPGLMKHIEALRAARKLTGGA